VRFERAMVFDEFIQGTTYTSATLNEFLGRYDQLAVHAFLDEVNITLGTFVIEAEQSSDGQHWDVGTLVSSGTVFNLPFNLFAGARNNSVALVRLKFYFQDAPSTHGHLRVFVTGRDSGAKEEVAAEVAFRKKAESIFCEYKVGKALAHCPPVKSKAKADEDEPPSEWCAHGHQPHGEPDPEDLHSDTGGAKKPAGYIDDPARPYGYGWRMWGDGWIPWPELAPSGKCYRGGCEVDPSECKKKGG